MDLLFASEEVHCVPHNVEELSSVLDVGLLQGFLAEDQAVDKEVS
jgi:hypothetical protein